ncbi:MAG: tetratricopeptide repeat protein [Prevotellaceae bacterium]|jgi:tetratricopeptide (TPR) repeat protein|nr:tetratricopeptide repeat protein [Prevotellaceae bacterium]
MNTIIQTFESKHLEKSPVLQTQTIINMDEGNPFKTIEKGTYALGYSLQEVVDRVNFLSEIDSALKDEALPVYLHSIGGIGKTTVAQVYCNSPQYAQQYDYIFWINASHEDVRKDVLNSTIFSFKEDSENTDNEFVRFVRQSNVLGEKVLLVIDNVVQIEQVRFIEKLSLLRWKVLVTTRALMDDRTFGRRVININELTCQYCEELFYSHFGATEESKERNRTDLHQILRLLNYHTALIVLLAKVGNKSRSIKKLLSILEENGIAHNDLQQVEIRDQEGKYATLYGHIESIFKIDRLTDEEKQILGYFSVLPDRPVPENVLVLWMKGDDKTETGLKRLFLRLFEKGWLIQERQDYDDEPILMYKCHGLIQNVLRKKLAPNSKNCSTLIRNMTDFLYVRDGEAYTHKIPYYDCVDAILRYIGEDSIPAYLLRKNYVSLLVRNSNSPKLSYLHAEYLFRNYEKVFYPNKNKKPKNWQADLVEIYRFYSMSYLDYSQDKGKYRIAYEWREEALAIAKKCLPKTDIQYLNAERYFAASQRMLDKQEEAIETLKNVLAKIDTLLVGKIHSVHSDLLYAQKETFNALGFAYTSISKKRANDGLFDEQIMYLKLALVARKKYVAHSAALYDENHTSMVAPYNNLGMTLLFLYEAGDKKAEYLEEAEKYLREAQRIKVKEFGTHCLSSARGLKNFATLYETRGEYSEARKMAEEALQIRKEILGDGRYRALMLSYRHIADICFSQWEAEKKHALLEEAEICLNKAIEIAEHLYSVDHMEYKTCSILGDKIRKAGTID